MGASWHPLARADAAVPERPPAGARPQPFPPGRQLLRPLLCGEEVCGGPEEFQQSPVAPLLRGAQPTAMRSRRAAWRAGARPLGLGGETTVTSAVGEEEEEMWVRLKEF